MTNHYARGARVENQVRDHLGERGYDVVRSAGSKGKIDLVAFNDHELCFIQVKITDGQTSPAERRELIRQATRAGACPLVAFKEKVGNRVHIRFRELTGVGPREYVPWIPFNEEGHGAWAE